ncbi:MAG: hypothetical protein GY906_08720 [bacterium]|nr:hypothetical protein [bacterium]
MMILSRAGLFLFRFLSVAACTVPVFRCTPAFALDFESPEQLLVDLKAELVMVVTVEDVVTRWAVIEHGDHMAASVATCRLHEIIHADGEARDRWPEGDHQKIAHWEPSDMFMVPIAPLPIEGRRYVVWAFEIPEGSGMERFRSNWLARPDGFFLLRGSGDQESFYWQGKSYRLTDVRRTLASGELMPLDQIEDPMKRIEVAQNRLGTGELGEINGFVRGLVSCVSSPETEVKFIESGAGDSGIIRTRDLGSLEHKLWYTGLAALTRLGRDAKHREVVVEALVSLLETARGHAHLAIALSLAEFGDARANKVLVKEYVGDSRAVSVDPQSGMQFPNRYPYDDNSVAAAAFALGQLGDRRGLDHELIEVQLAAADGSASAAPEEVLDTLTEIAEDLNAEVEELRMAGRTTALREKGDYTRRLPRKWIKVHALLANLGKEKSFRKLVDALIEDATTYPKEDDQLVPRMRTASWTSRTRGWPSLESAIFDADDQPEALLERLESAYGGTAHWDEPTLRGLRSAIDGSTQESPAGGVEQAQEEVEPAQAEMAIRVAGLLSSPAPEERAEGLAAAGFHGIDRYYDTVVEHALTADGVERQAAVYGLGFYAQEPQEYVLTELLEDEDLEMRVSAFELATRFSPERFADVALGLVIDATNAAQEATQDEQWRCQNRLQSLARILARFSRSAPLTNGLSHSDPTVKLVYVNSLALGGHPNAVSALVGLRGDQDSTVQAAVEAALMVIGPVGEEAGEH